MGVFSIKKYNLRFQQEAYLRLVSLFFSNILKHKHYMVIRGLFSFISLWILLFTVFSGSIFLIDYIKEKEKQNINEAAFELKIQKQLNEYFLILKQIENISLAGVKIEALIQKINKLSVYFDEKDLVGLRWISSNKDILSRYGKVQSREEIEEGIFLYELQKTPNKPRIYKNINNIYKIGCAKFVSSIFMGYLILPINFEYPKAESNLIDLTILALSFIEEPASGKNSANKIESTKYLYVDDKIVAKIKFGKNLTSYKYFKDNIYLYLTLFLLSFLIMLLFVIFWLRKSKCHQHNLLEKSNETSKFENQIRVLKKSVTQKQETSKALFYKKVNSLKTISELSSIILQCSKYPENLQMSDQQIFSFIEKINENSSDTIMLEDVQILNLEPLLNEALRYWSFEVLEKNIFLDLKIPKEDLCLETEREGLLRLLLCIYGMAVDRSSYGGTICIRICKKQNNGEKLIEISVEDNGFTFTEQEICKYTRKEEGEHADVVMLSQENLAQLSKNLGILIETESQSSGFSNKITLKIPQKFENNKKNQIPYDNKNVVPFLKK